MTLKSSILLGLLSCFSWAEVTLDIDNTNFTLAQDNGDFYNYDRLRLRSDITKDDYFATFIFDMINYQGNTLLQSPNFSQLTLRSTDTRFSTRTELQSNDFGIQFAKIHRAYAGFEDDKNRIVLGLQNVTMGVGHIWTPSNLFNPRNTLSLEPNEIYGVFALNYSRHLSDTAKLMLLTSQRADKSFKYASQLKGFYDGFDMGVNLFSSQTTTMVATEIEGHLSETGIEIRTEIVYLKSSLTDSTLNTQNKELFQAIIGADYGFVNGVTLTLEALYSSKTFSSNTILQNSESDIAQNLTLAPFYVAGSLQYALNLSWATSLVYIESFATQHSRFIAPTLSYTINDFNTLNFGALLQSGSVNSEYGAYPNTYYIQYSLNF